MPLKPRRIPSYRLHKPSGQARVFIDRRHIYLGKHGSPESWEKHNRLIAERLNGGSGTPASLSNGSRPVPAISVTERMAAYWRFAARSDAHPCGS